jgi:hypothetical protein
MVRKNKPLRAVRAVSNSYGLFERKLALASTPDLRIAVAADHLRAAVKRADPALAVRVADQVFGLLVAKASEVQAATVAAAERRRVDVRVSR